MSRAFDHRPFLQIAGFICLLAAIHLINAAGSLWLLRFGVIPRTVIGLRGVIFSPLLHASWSHLLANAGPLAGLLSIMALVNPRPLWINTAAIWLASGTAVWLFGRPGAVQVGASGLIYGLGAFLVAAGWFNRQAKTALAAAAVIFLYGGAVYGLLPSQPGVSWEGHLCGAAAGVWLARAASGGQRRLR